MEETKKYTNGEITIVWKPSACIHSTRCWKGPDGLKEVFNPAVRPWIKPEGASSQRIMEQVNKCPSGALSGYYNQEGPAENAGNGTKVEVMQNGPLLVHGSITVQHRDGNTENRTKVTAFCRCGKSASKPFCDGSHVTEGFSG